MAAADGDEALALVKRESLDLVLLDIQMPGLAGIEALRQIKKLDRDLQKCAIKCSAIDRDGVWHDVHKDPITDPGKRSKAGRLMLINDGGYHTVRVGESDLPNLLELVFRNGEVLRDQTFADIRRRALL